MNNPRERARSTLAPSSVERALSQSLASMRQVAADGDPGDYWQNWSRELLDRRPLMLIAALLPDETLTWVVEPDVGTDAHHDGVLLAQVGHPFRENHAEVTTCHTKALPTIAEEVSWLVRETGRDVLKAR